MNVLARMRKIGLPAVALGLILPVKAEERAVPADLGPKLERIAIVGEAVRACGRARPELFAEVGAAWQAWLRRNPDLNSALDMHLAGTPEGDAVLYLFHSLETSRGADEHVGGDGQQAIRCSLR